MTALRRALHAESLKLRGTLALWMCLIAPATVVALYVLQVSFSEFGMRTGGDPAKAWFAFSQSILVLWLLLMLPLFITLQSALLAGLEHGERQWKHLLALPVPRSLPDEQAAMLFVNPLTAHVLTHEVLRVRRGATVLVTAAGSALGRMIIRLGRARGFQTIAVVRREAQAAELRALGADWSIAVSSDNSDMLRAEVHQITAGRGVPYALDCVGGELGTSVIRCLTLGGHAVLYGTLGRAPITLSVRDLMMPAARISGFFLPSWLAQQSLITKIRVLRAVVGGIERGLLSSDIAATFPLESYEEAISLATRPGHTGKVLFRF